MSGGLLLLLLLRMMTNNTAQFKFQIILISAFIFRLSGYEGTQDEF
jgi:hypothetical protein